MEPDRPDDLLRRPPELAEQFDRIAGAYDARPDYPAELFEMLVERCGLGRGTRVLEVGAGTGKATLTMLELGARITAVEPGPALAEVLTSRTAGQAVEVVESRFEDVDVPAASFDLVASATAFHWVDPDIGVAKIAHALRDGGKVALWWTLWGDADRPDPFRDALEPVLRAKAPHLLDEKGGLPVYVRDVDARAAMIDTSDDFGPVETTVLRWEGRHEPVELRRLFATFAQWIALPEPLRSELLDDVERLARDEFDGTVLRPYQTRLYVASRIRG